MAIEPRPQEVLPNPPALTNEAIEKAIAGLKEQFQSQLAAVEKAIEVFHDDLVRVPTLLDRAILSLRELHEIRFEGMERELVALRDFLISKLAALEAVTNGKFEGVTSQFIERDTRTDQRAGDTKLAVDAAFAAAKEATAKIEMGFTKSIDGQADLLKTITTSLEDKISDLKDRVVEMGGRSKGIGDGIGWLIGVAGVIIAALVLILEHH